MKKARKLFAITLVLMLMFQAVGMIACAEETAGAVSAADMQKSVVYIETSCRYVSQNANLEFSATYGGTGFAIGEVGKPVQYLASCAHVVEQPNGMYFVVYNSKTGETLYSEKVNDGVVPDVEVMGNIVYLTDYFEVTSHPMAIYSYSTQDRVLLSVLESNYERDVAICKIATPVPTTKLEARPLLMRTETKTGKANVSVGDGVYAIGYPGSADYVNTEARYDYSDSVVTKGVISKIQLTTGSHGSKQQFYTYMIDANITNGNSGGPLFTEDGSIIGLNSFGVKSKYSETAPANYSIAVEEVVKLIDTARIPCTIIESKDEQMEEPAEAAEATEAAVPEVTEAAEVLAAPTEQDNAVSPTLIGIIIAAVIVVALIVVLVILLARKNKDKTVQNVPAVEKKTADNRIPATVLDDRTVGAKGAGETIVIPKSNLYLVGIRGPMEGKKFAIEDKAVIGRDSTKCSIVFASNQPGVSGLHCEVYRAGDALALKDLNSRYGTFLKDGTKLTPNEPVVLQDGDWFLLGDKNIVFEVRY